MREDANNITIDLGRLIYQLYQKMALIILCGILLALAGFLLSSFVIAPKYSASAEMLVNNRDNETQQSTAITQSDINASNSLVNTYAIILKSHDLLEKVEQECGLDYSLESLSSMITVKSVNSTQVMRINVESRDPEEALAICTSMIRLAPDAIIKAIDAGSVSTVSSPYTTGRPVSPSKRNFTLVGGMIGLLLSAAVVIILELSNDRFKTTEDVRQILDLNVLGVIPEENVFKTEKKKRKRKEE